MQLVTQMNSMAFIGFPVAEQYFGFDGHPTELYVRSFPSQVGAVAAVLPATVALLVGGVGIANVMVIPVLERRREIGLRRALGATRRHIAEQFLTEALLLSVLGGLTGTLTGIAATAIYALTQRWAVQIPAQALYGGTGAALAIGAIAGLYPSIPAARLSPTEALRAA